MPSASSARSGTSATSAPRPYISKVGVLPSSLPDYHKAYVEREKAGIEEDPTPPALPDEPDAVTRTEAEREEMARRLKPHSKNQLRLEEGSRRPQGMTPVSAPPPKRIKPVRWQFGIRSRNAPWEALLCIHKALHKLGATYVPDEGYDKAHDDVDDREGSAEGSFDDGFGSGTQPSQRGSNSTASIDPQKRYKLPADPWHIKVRWETRRKAESLFPW